MFRQRRRDYRRRHLLRDLQVFHVHGGAGRRGRRRRARAAGLRRPAAGRGQCRSGGDGDSHHHRRRSGLCGVGAGWHRGHRGRRELVRERQQRGVAVAAFGHRIRRLQRHRRSRRGHVEPVHSLGGRSGHVAQDKGHLRCWLQHGPDRAGDHAAAGVVASGLVQRGLRLFQRVELRLRSSPSDRHRAPVRAGVHDRIGHQRLPADGGTPRAFNARTHRGRDVGGACRRRRQACGRAAFGCATNPGHGHPS